jgi:carboxylesterase type B
MGSLSLQSSSGNWPGYSPTSKLANTTNTVYVSMNYRLHAFGFMALDILSSQSPNNVW